MRRVLRRASNAVIGALGGSTATLQQYETTRTGARSTTAKVGDPIAVDVMATSVTEDKVDGRRRGDMELVISGDADLDPKDLAADWRVTLDGVEHPLEPPVVAVRPRPGGPVIHYKALVRSGPTTS